MNNKAIGIENMQNQLMKMTNSLKRNKYVSSISDGLIAIFPILMVGALFSIINNMPFQPLVNLLRDTGLKPIISLPGQLTTGLIAVYAVYSISYKLASSYGKDGITAGFISLVSFFIVTPLTTIDENGTLALTFKWTGAGGLFVSFILALVFTRIYVAMIDKKFFISMPKGVPPTTTKAFMGLVPMFTIVLLALLMRGFFALTSFGDIHSLVYQILQLPLSNLGNTLLVFLLLKLITNILWMFGIHGGLVMFSVAVPLWLSMDAANLQAFNAGQPLPYILGYAFGMLFFQFSGTGNTIGLNLLMLRAKSKRYQTLGKLALPASICGVNEPLIFGTPIVLNPMLAIPFILNPLISGVLAYALTVIGVLPHLNGIFVFGTPFGISGFLAGGWRTALFQILILVPLSVIMYLPFFRKLDTIAFAEEHTDQVNVDKVKSQD